MKTFNSSGNLISAETPLIMGILNVTSDSFFASSRTVFKDDIIRKTVQYLEQGVDIIDIGAVSTRPNSEKMPSEEEEIEKISMALNVINKEFPKLTISCDTFRAKVVDVVVKNFNVSMINDISGGNFDPEMIPTIARVQIPYVLTHSKGNIKTMHTKTTYDNLITEIMQFFSKKLHELRIKGVNDIIIDPGFGFSKTLDQNYELLKRISYLRDFDCPMLVGVSRKSMFYKLFDKTPEESLNATNIANYHALISGASILRVHDIEEAKETAVLYKKLMNS